MLLCVPVSNEKLHETTCFGGLLSCSHHFKVTISLKSCKWFWKSGEGTVTSPRMYNRIVILPLQYIFKENKPVLVISAIAPDTETSGHARCT